MPHPRRYAALNPAITITTQRSSHDVLTGLYGPGLIHHMDGSCRALGAESPTGTPSTAPLAHAWSSLFSLAVHRVDTPEHLHCLRCVVPVVTAALARCPRLLPGTERCPADPQAARAADQAPLFHLVTGHAEAHYPRGSRFVASDIGGIAKDAGWTRPVVRGTVSVAFGVAHPYLRWYLRRTYGFSTVTSATPGPSELVGMWLDQVLKQGRSHARRPAGSYQPDRRQELWEDLTATMAAVLTPP